MNWASIIIAVLASSVIASTITQVSNFFLNKQTYKNEKDTWFRDAKLKAFTKLSKDLLSYGMNNNKGKDAFTMFHSSAQAFLL